MVTFVGQKLAGTIRDDRIELQRSSDSGRGASMTGRVERNEMSGEFTLADRQGKWKATRAPVRPPNAPRLHTFEPKEFPRFFSWAIEPALRIYPGDTVQTWSVDSAGMDPKGVRRSPGGNPLTGPFYVEGAMPGDVLAVKFTRIRPNRDTAIAGGSLSTNAITPDYVQTRKRVPFYNSSWILDRDKGIARLAEPTDALKDYSVPLKPILGSAGSLTEALQVATTQMAGWLADQYKLNSAEVASVLGTAMQYDIAEIVDPNMNVVARLSKKALAQIRKQGT